MLKYVDYVDGNRMYLTADSPFVGCCGNSNEFSSYVKRNYNFVTCQATKSLSRISLVHAVSHLEPFLLTLRLPD